MRATKTETVTGRCSIFGGPNDHRVGPGEGLALCGPHETQMFAALDIFLPQQPKGTTGLARRLNPDAHYCAMRWSYKKTPRKWLQGHGVTVINPRTHVAIVAQPIDWGPNEDTGRIVDLSPGLASDLGLVTDDECTVVIPLP